MTGTKDEIRIVDLSSDPLREVAHRLRQISSLKVEPGTLRIRL